MFPNNIPNLNQILFRGVSIFELNIPNTRKIIEIINDHNLISSALSNGHKPISKNSIKNTIPKFLFVPISIII